MLPSKAYTVEFVSTQVGPEFSFGMCQLFTELDSSIFSYGIASFRAWHTAPFYLPPFAPRDERRSENRGRKISAWTRIKIFIPNSISSPPNAKKHGIWGRCLKGRGGMGQNDSKSKSMNGFPCSMSVLRLLIKLAIQMWLPLSTSKWGMRLKCSSDQCSTPLISKSRWTTA